ncbi:MAG: hypothetical protein IJY57_01925 [Clostridia bacterium]|nr:hypothetical protein [Clostridia bacterium]
MDKDKRGKTLIIKSGKDSFERYFASRISELGFKVLFVEQLFNPYAKNRKKEKNNLKSNLIELKQNGFFDAIEKVIVFDTFSAIPHIKKVLNKETQLYSYLWNTIYSFKGVLRSKLNKLFSKVYSFDSAEAKKYKLNYNSQFYFDQPLSAPNNDGYVFFIGEDKGRAMEVVSLAKYCEQNNISYDFTIVGNNLVSEKYSPVKVGDSFVEYEEVLEKVRSDKCIAILDLVRSGQVGLTIRAMEALFFGKKLITNNKSILYSKFYEKDNVFVLGLDDFSKLKEFLITPIKPYNEQAKEYYSFENWIERFN